MAAQVVAKEKRGYLLTGEVKIWCYKSRHSKDSLTEFLGLSTKFCEG
jgi:hypothetical protein